jgi:hypothetical protein
MTKNVTVISIVCIAFFLQACSGSAISREDEIKQYIETGVKAAENRSSRDLAELIDENYLDHKKLNKTQITKLARLYFFRHKKIFLFTKIDGIEFVAENQAIVNLHVAMAGSVISDASALSSLRAKIYKFELELIKQEEWLLQRARWEGASLGDM